MKLITFNKYHKEKATNTEASLNTKGNKLDSLQFVSLMYLGVPLMLFFISWLKWYYSLSIVSLVIFTQPRYQLFFNRNSIKKFCLYSMVLGLSLLLTRYGEADDWTKHKAILYELFKNWNRPVFLNYLGEEYILSYGLGFYVIPSLISGFLKSFYLIKWLVFVNSIIGLTLIGLWLNRLFDIPLWGMFFVFLLGRFEWLYGLLFYLENFTHSQIVGYVSFNYIPFTIEQLPQHFIPTLLVFLIVYSQMRLNTLNLIFFSYVIFFGFFWTPFLPFSILPLLILIKRKHFIEFLDWRVLLKTTPAVIIGAFLIYYYYLHIPIPLYELSYEFIGIKHLIYLLLTRYFLLFVIYLLIIFYTNSKLHFMNRMELKMIFSLLIFSIFFKQIKYGFYNDFELKTTFMIVVVLNIYIYKSLSIFTLKANYVFKVFLSITLLASFFSLIFFLYLKISPLSKNQLLSKIKCNILTNEIKEIGLEKALSKKSIEENYPFYEQYLGAKNIVVNSCIKNPKQ